MNRAGNGPNSVSRGRRFDWSRLVRLSRKELRETLRDRRTLLTLFLMPLIVYPLLGIIFQRFLFEYYKATAASAPVIGFATDEARNALHHFLSLGELILRNDLRKDASANSGRPNLIDPQAMVGTEMPIVDRPSESVAASQVDVAVVMREPNNRAHRGRSLNLEILYRPRNPRSLETLRFVEERLRAVNERYLIDQIREAQPNAQVPAQFAPRPVADLDDKAVSISAIVPLVLILTTITGAVYPAIDLTAGERERGTLEALIAAPVPRVSLLTAKYIAVLTVAVLTGCINLVGMTITIGSTGLSPMLFGQEGLSLPVMIQVFLLLVLFAAFFSAVLLILTSFARSFKEAQAYLIPLMLISLGPGIASLIPGLAFTPRLAVIPLLNIVLLARDIFAAQASGITALVAILSTLLYSAAAIALAARIFGTDAILYGSQGSVTDWLRPPRQPAATATTSGALLTLAALFPAFFVTSSLLARWETSHFEFRLLANGLLSLILFVVIPLAIAQYRQITAASGFLLHRAPFRYWLAALLLGASLWPFVYELQLLQQSWLQINEQLAAQIETMAKNWTNIHIGWILATMAVAAAISEEFFFRGYVFASLQRTTRWAIMLSALVFGLFHIVFASVLAIERMIPSTLLGLVLGWLCWRSGSVFPGMLLHALHNGILLAWVKYREPLVTAGWFARDQAHLPGWLMLLAAALVVGGWLVARRSPS